MTNTAKTQQKITLDANDAIVAVRPIPTPAGSTAYAEARLNVALGAARNGQMMSAQLLLQQILCDLAIEAVEVAR